MDIGDLSLVLGLRADQAEALQQRLQLQLLVESEQTLLSAKALGMTDDDIAFFGQSLPTAVRGMQAGISIDKLRAWGDGIHKKVNAHEMIEFLRWPGE